MAEALVEQELNADPRSKEGRTALAGMVIRLFDLWRLPMQDQMSLLGLSESSRMTLARYRKGEPFEDRRDFLDRVANLLSIHRSLRVLFPKNRELGYRWPSTPNKTFDGLTPVEVIRRDGFLGLLEVKRYLDFQRGQ